MTMDKSNFIFYIYTLFLDRFCAMFMMLYCKFGKMRGEETFLTDVFGHYQVQAMGPLTYFLWNGMSVDRHIWT